MKRLVRLHFEKSQKSSASAKAQKILVDFIFSPISWWRSLFPLLVVRIGRLDKKAALYGLGWLETVYFK